MLSILLVLAMLQGIIDGAATHEDRLRSLEQWRSMQEVQQVTQNDAIARNTVHLADIDRLDIDHRLTQVETEFRIIQTLLGAIGITVLGQVIYMLTNGYRRRNGGKSP